jgi:hypothetical protein
MKKKEKLSPPPWKQSEPTPMLVVHITTGELEGFDNLQGGPSIDPETGLREYSKLGPIIENPEIRALFHHISDELISDGKITPTLKKIYKTARKSSLPYVDAPAEKSPIIHKIEETGRKPDKHMALLPMNLVMFLIELKHQVSINPKTNLLEFGFFKSVGRIFGGAAKGVGNLFSGIAEKVPEVIRIGGTIGGALLGGPMGAGFGNALASLATGKNPGDSLIGGIKNAGLMAGIGSIGGALPGLGGAISGALGNISPTLATGASSLLSGNAIGAAAPSIEQQFLSQARQNAGLVPTPSSGVGSLLGGGALAMMPLMKAGLALHGEKQHHKNELERHKQHREEMEKMRKEMGFGQSWAKPTKRNLISNPDFRYDERTGAMSGPMYIDSGPAFAKGGHVVSTYNKGALIKGPGDGQADKIKTSVPNNTFILPADVTSAFGNGSSENGGKVLNEWENSLKSKIGKEACRILSSHVKKESNPVPVWLSNNEYGVSPLSVMILGKGSSEKGVNNLKSLMKNVRKHQMSNGTNLPPKAKHPMQYIKDTHHGR